MLSGLSAKGDDWIIFPHQLHVVEEELECTVCHEGVTSSTSLDTRLLPTMETCADCHEDDTDGGDCSMCHANPENPLPFMESQPADVVDYSHQYHLNLKMKCFDCHAWVKKDDGLKPATVWTAEDCKQCHMRTKPENHNQAWTLNHGAEINPATQLKCNLCHESSSCDQCHQLQQFEPRTHPVDYLLVHAYDVRSGTLECTTCHDPVDDCYQCHTQNQVMPMTHNFPDWVNLSLPDGGRHSDAALEEPDICQTCHLPARDFTCERCHDTK